MPRYGLSRAYTVAPPGSNPAPAGWLARPLVLLAVSLALLLAAAPVQGQGPALAWPAEGTLHLTLERALRIQGLADRQPSHLHVELYRRQGDWHSTGWAWVETLPGRLHPVQLSQILPQGPGLTLKLQITFGPSPPDWTGGSATLEVDVAGAPEHLIGTYQCEARGWDRPQAQQQWRELGGRGEPGWRGGITTGTTSSLTHIAAQRGDVDENLAIVARATFQPGSALPPARLGAHPRSMVARDQIEALRGLAGQPHSRGYLQACERHLSTPLTAAPEQAHDAAGPRAWATLLLAELRAQPVPTDAVGVLMQQSAEHITQTLASEHRARRQARLTWEVTGLAQTLTWVQALGLSSALEEP